MKRKSYEEKSVLAYMEKGESYEATAKRLDRLWNEGKHPVQLERLKKLEKRGE